MIESASKCAFVCKGAVFVKPDLSESDFGVGEIAVAPSDDIAAALVGVLARHTTDPGACWMALWAGYGYVGGPDALIAELLDDRELTARSRR